MKNFTRRLCSLTLAMALIVTSLGIGVVVPASAGTPDPMTTYSYSDLPAASMTDAAYGNGVYVATGYYGAIIKSTDGNTWQNVKTKADSGSYTGVTDANTFGFSSVAFGNNVFVATGSNGVILTSSDGTNWTQRSSGITTGLGDVEYLEFMGVSAFYVCAEGKILKSTDGITWTNFTPTGLTSWATEITAGENGAKLVVGRDNGDIIYTANGSTWTTVHPSTVVADGTASANANNMVKWVNGRYYITDASGFMWYSTNLSTFTLMGAPFRQLVNTPTIQMFNMLYDGTTYYMFGFNGTNYGGIYTSTNGTTWTMQPYKDYFVGQSCAYLNGKYFRLGNEGMMVSDDASNWSYKWGGTFNDITFDGVNYIAAGRLGGNGAVWRSTDLTTWTKGTVDDVVGTFNGVAYGNNQYMAIGENATINGNNKTLIATSTDGNSWTKRGNMSDGTSFYDIVYNGNKFVAVGSIGYTTPVIRYTTTGGNSWTDATFSAPGIGSIANVDYVNNQFIALGSDASTTVAILTSADGITWVNHGTDFPSQADQLINIVYDGTKYVMATLDTSSYKFKTWSSTDLTTWTGPTVINYTGNYAYGSQLSTKGGKLYLVATSMDATSSYVLFSDDHGATWSDSAAVTAPKVPYGTVNANNRIIVLGDSQLAVATAAGPVNALPSVGTGISTTFTEQTPTLIAPSMTVNDADGDTEWDGGSLKVQITAHNTADDSIYLPTTNGGGIWVNTTGNILMANTTPIGTINAAQATNGDALIVNFNSTATNSDVQNVARAFTFNNNLDNPSNLTRTVTFTATDKNTGVGTGTVSLSITRVNDAPTGLPTISGTATHGETLTADASAIADLDGLGTFSYQWQVSADGSTGWSDIGSATATTLTLSNNEAAKYVRVKVSYTDGSGNNTSVYSASTSQVAILPAHTATSAAASGTPIAGEANNITLTVKDSVGSTDTTFTGAKNVTISNVQQAPNNSYGSFNGTTLTSGSQTVSVTFTNGVAVVDLKLNKASAQSIGFNIAGVTTPATNSTSITPVADTVASLVVSTQPVAGASSGSTFATQPVVTLKDQFGNTCATGVSATASVTASAKAGTGTYTLGGTTTKSAVAGVATFTDLTASLLTVGNGAITFTSTVTVDSNTFTIPLISALALTADTTNNNVDNDLEITFTDDANFRSAITGITYGGHALTANQYTITAGKITLKPSNADNNYLRVAGTEPVVVIATGYNNASVSQTIQAGAVANLVVSTQPVPGLSSGSVMATQPVVTLKDQYNNICSTGPSTTAAVVASAKAGTGTYTLGGTLSRNAVAGVATFNDLSVTLLTSGTGAVTFTSTGTVDSNTFNIPLFAGKTLTADTTNNTVDSDLEITFADDAAFRSAITSISYNGHVLTPNQYTIEAGKITLKPSVNSNAYLRVAGTANVVIEAAGYNNSTVSQSIEAGAVATLVVTTQPVAGTTSGAVFATQPVVTLKDQYNNVCTTGPSSTASVVATAKAGTGSYTLGGTSTKSAVAGVVTYTDLSATLVTLGTGGITFTSTGTVDSNLFTIPLFEGKLLTADTTDNNVDNDLEVTFTDDANFRSHITEISYNGHTLAPSQYVITAGKITFKPSDSTNAFLRTAGSGNIVIHADGYNDSTIAQTIQAGAAASIAVVVQPVAGTTSGSSFTTQPTVVLKDQYNNVCTTGASATANIVASAKAGTGTYTLGGTLTQAAVSGQVSFAGLTATLLTVGNGAITFTSGGLTVDSDNFNIPLNAAISLTPDTTANTVDNDIEVTFTDDAAFRNAITSISYNGHVLTPNQYVISSGKITLKPSVADNQYLRTVANDALVIVATGYNNSSVNQSIQVGAAAKLAVTQNVTAPTANGAVFAQQPKVSIQDQYGNLLTADNSTVVTVSKFDSGQWTLEGTLTATAVNGVATFTGLKGTNTSGVASAQLAFNASGLAQAVSATVVLPAKSSGSDKGGGGGTSGSSAGSTTGTGAASNPSTPAPKSGVTVVVNGKEETAGTEVKTVEANKSVVTVVVDKEIINTKIDTAVKSNPTGEGNLVEVSVADTNSQVAKVELTGDIVKKLETNTFEIAINRDNVSYVIPAKELSISTVADSLGVKTEALKDIKVEVKISEADTATTTKYNEVVKSNGGEMVFPPTKFEIVAKATKADGTSADVNIDKFNTYVERILEIPSNVDPSKITTGIVFNADGTYSHVPTEVFQQDGKWFAKLNSLTNSDYSVIWNPIKVASVEKHWAKKAVNDMASRLVVFNYETFKPNDAITRADFAEYIVRALGIYREGSKHDNPFTDVKATDDRTLAILIANEYGIIKGYADGTFKPDALITREEAMTMYEKAMSIAKLGSVNADKYKAFSDYNQASDWAKAYIQTVVGAGVFNGKTGTELAPKANLTYAEAVQAIRNLLVAAKLINQ